MSVTYWDENLAQLKEYLPAIHSWVEQQDPDDLPDVSDFEPYDGSEWFAQLEEIDWYTGILLGFGDGAHVQKLIELYPERGLYVLEPEPGAFLQTCRDRDLSGILSHPDLSILLIHQPDTRLIAGRIFTSLKDHMMLGRIVALNWPPYEERHKEFWESFNRHVQEHIKQEATNVSTYRRYSLEWQRNVWANLPYAVTDPGAGSLFLKFINRPAILVASGPSLEKNIHLLHEAKGSALIVAAGSGIEPLRRAGIQPDLVLSFDASEQNAEPFENIDMPGLPLIYSGVIWPSVVADWTGPRFAMEVDVYPFEAWLYHQLGQNKGEVSSGPSVANVTWDLLMRMGCNPIALVGQDLALTNGQSHAAGVRSATSYDLDAEGETYELVDGVDGGQVKTTMIMLTFKTWFEQRILGWTAAQEHHGDVVQKTIDCTEGGARIEGTELLTLREFLDTYCTEDFDPAGRIAELHEANKPGPLGDGGLDGLRASLLAGLNNLSAYCRQSIDPLQELYTVSQNGVSGEKILPLAQQLAILDRRLSGHELHRQFMEPAMRQYGHNYTVLSNQLKAESDPKRAAELIVALYSTYFADTQRTMTDIAEIVGQGHETTI